MPDVSIVSTLLRYVPEIVFGVVLVMIFGPKAVSFLREQYTGRFGRKTEANSGVASTADLPCVIDIAVAFKDLRDHFRRTGQGGRVLLMDDKLAAGVFCDEPPATVPFTEVTAKRPDLVVIDDVADGRGPSKTGPGD